MTLLTFVLYAIFAAHNQEATYYVSTNGSDSQQCGSQIHPCASINQVIVNNPSGSFTVSIADGSYPTSNIDLSNLSVIIFQGTSNTVINASWESVFINTGQAPGFEFRDILLSLSDDGILFASINFEKCTVGFYNVIFFYSKYSGNFIEVYGGSLILNNCTFDHAKFETDFIFVPSYQLVSNITVSYSIFSNLYEAGLNNGLIYVVGPLAANVVVDNSVFTNCSSDSVILAFGVWENQQFMISNCLFSTLLSSDTSVSFDFLYTGAIIHVQNTTWFNATSQDTAGGLYVEGIHGDIYYDNVVLFDHLNFTMCTGSYCGGLIVCYNSLTLSNSTFADNMGTGSNCPGDVLQVLNGATEKFPCSITNSYSSSDAPKASILNIDENSFVDISDQLPSPPVVSFDFFLEHRHHLPLTSSLVIPSSSSKRRRVSFTAKRPHLGKEKGKEKDLSDES